MTEVAGVVFPMPKTDTERLWEAVPALVEGVRSERIERWHRLGVVVGWSHRVETVPDGRFPGGGRVLWRIGNGLYEPTAEVPGEEPDAVVVDKDDLGATRLRALDEDMYRIEARRALEEHERFQAEQARRRQDEDKALCKAPKKVWQAARGGPGLDELLKSLFATHCTISVCDGRRLLVRYPGVLNGKPVWAADIERLRPLLIASDCGRLDVRCDVPGCKGQAQHVALGGAFVCEAHHGGK